MKIIVTSFLLAFLVLTGPVLAMVSPNDTYYSHQWYLSKIKADSAWEKISESPNIIIAVIDSGVDINHPDLRDNIWQNTREIKNNEKDDDRNGFIDDFNGWDFVINRPDPAPKLSVDWTESGISHGTIMAGIIAARGNNGQGVAGVTWRAKIMPLRVLSEKGEGKISDVIRAIDYATNNGADIINLSFVNFSYSQGVYEAIVRAYKAGVIVVAAAGNEQSAGQAYDTDKTPIYPACYDGMNKENMVIGVIATDALDQKAGFSSYGSRCVDIAAPGISFFSTVSPLGNNEQKYYDGFWSGTSMAAPLVSAALALIAQVNPELSRQEIVDILLSSSDNIDKLNPQYTGKVGSGRLNVSQAVSLAKEKLYSRLGRLLLSPLKGEKEIILTAANGDFVEKIHWKENVLPGSSFAIGDVNNDGHEEIVVGAPLGVDPEIKIFNQDGRLINKFLAFEPSFRGGLNVALAGLKSGGKTEIVVTSASAGTSQIKIFDTQGKLINQFFAGSKDYFGALSVAVGDLEGNSDDKIVVAYGAGQEPQIKIFSRQGRLIGVFLAYEKSFRGGVNIAVTNLDGRSDNNKDEIIVAPGPGREPHIKIFNNYGQLQKQFLGYGKNWQGGVRITGGDLNNDGMSEIILGANYGAAPHVRVFDRLGSLIESFYAWESNFSGGVNPSIIKIRN